MKTLLPKLSAGQWLWLVSLGLAFDLWWINRAPSEEAMARTFFEHRREFEEMRALALRETSGADNRFAPGESSSTPRRLRITGLMRRLGVDIAYFDNRKQTQRFGAFGGGFADTTWSIGYMYSATPPSPIVASAYAVPRTKSHRHFARLADGWYIYHFR